MLYSTPRDDMFHRQKRRFPGDFPPASPYPSKSGAPSEGRGFGRRARKRVPTFFRRGRKVQDGPRKSTQKGRVGHNSTYFGISYYPSETHLTTEVQNFNILLE